MVNVGREKQPIMPIQTFGIVRIAPGTHVARNQVLRIRKTCNSAIWLDSPNLFLEHRLSNPGRCQYMLFGWSEFWIVHNLFGVLNKSLNRRVVANSRFDRVLAESRRTQVLGTKY